MILTVGLMGNDRQPGVQTLPTNFRQVSVASGISNPTVIVFASDGRIFVCQQNGSLVVIKNGVKLSSAAFQLTVNFGYNHQSQSDRSVYQNVRGNFNTLGLMRHFFDKL